MILRITVDSSRCQGHGRCLDDSPEIFEMDDQGYAVVVQPEISTDLAASVRRAEVGCPERAIVVTESSTDAAGPPVGA